MFVCLCVLPFFWNRSGGSDLVPDYRKWKQWKVWIAHHSPALQRTEEIGWAHFSWAQKTGIKVMSNKPGTLSNISCLFHFFSFAGPRPVLPFPHWNTRDLRNSSLGELPTLTGHMQGVSDAPWGCCAVVKRLLMNQLRCPPWGLQLECKER